MRLYDSGFALVELAASFGYTHTQLARALDVSEAAVSQWAAGETQPRADLLLQFAFEVGLSPEELEGLLATGHYPRSSSEYVLRLHASCLQSAPESVVPILRQARQAANNGAPKRALRSAEQIIETLERSVPRHRLVNHRRLHLLIDAHLVRLKALHDVCIGEGLREPGMDSIRRLRAALDALPDGHAKSRVRAFPILAEAELEYMIAAQLWQIAPRRAHAAAIQATILTELSLEAARRDNISPDHRCRMARQLALLYALRHDSRGFADTARRLRRDANRPEWFSVAPTGCILAYDGMVRGLTYFGEVRDALHTLGAAEPLLRRACTQPGFSSAAEISLRYSELMLAAKSFDIIASVEGRASAELRITRALQTASAGEQRSKLADAQVILQRSFGIEHGLTKAAAANLALLR